MGNLYNYQTQRYETVDALTTEEQAMRYLPNMPEAHSLFAIHRFNGASVAEALILVIEASMAKNIQAHQRLLEML